MLDIQPIIATLILMTSGRGVGLMINLLYGGTDPSFKSPLLQGLSVGHLGIVPTRLVLFAAIFALLWLLVRRTAFGLMLEAVGSNPAARPSPASTRASSSTRPTSSPPSAPAGPESCSPPTRTPPIPSASA